MFPLNGSSVKMENVKLNSQILQLPDEICKNENVFNAFFSFETWKSLSPAIREHLTSNFLPDFDNNRGEKEKTVNALFSRKITNFNVEVLSRLQKSLSSGKLMTSKKKKHKKIWLCKREKKSYDECHRIFQMLKKLTAARNKILQTKNDKLIMNSLAHCPRSAFHIYKKSTKRYFSELSNISMCDEAGLSSDELEDYTRTKTSKKLKINQTLNFSNSISKTYDTEDNARMINFDEKWYKDALSSHQKRKDLVKNDFTINDIEEVFERSQISRKIKRAQSKSLTFANKKQTSNSGRLRGRPKSNRSMEEEANKKKNNTEPSMLSNSNESTCKIEQKENCFVDSLCNVRRTTSNSNVETFSVNTKNNIDLRQFKQESVQKPKDAGNLSDLDTTGIIQIPLDFADVDHMNLLDDTNSKMPELLQETHACFLSLIRDILCSTTDHRMSLDELKRKVNFWLLNPITPLNDWYHLSENWFNLLPSAVFFLTGEFTDQPEDFVPYLEYKAHLNIYQWIGAGRDTDNNLVPLCTYWLSRRNDMGTNKSCLPSKPNMCIEEIISLNSKFDESSSLDTTISPPPARCPTDWTVTIATKEEIEDFQEQERRRYANPHMPFTYNQHGYESVVGPIKGIYTQQVVGITKARGHNMLVQNRPNFVTILTLVRDAAARLPNGEGTRAEICELLKSSQYINPTASDQILQTIVSGALDRMHTEPDPCVKYDSKRKIWIYLHRNRSESEFEQIHLQQQCVMKPKKIICKKSKTKSDKVVTSSTVGILENTSAIDSVKNVIHKLITPGSTIMPSQIVSQKCINISKSIEPYTVKPVVASVIHKKSLTPSTISNNNKNTVQNIVATKVPIQKTLSPSEPNQQANNFLTKVSALQLSNLKNIKTAETPTTLENKTTIQNDLSELGKIGIIPQKIIQVSPKRFQTNAKGNVLALNKIPISLANYTTDINQKIIQVKPVGGTIAGVSSESLSSLRKANFQIKSPNVLTNTTTSDRVINSMTRPASLVTVKNIQSLPTLNLANKGDLSSVKVQTISRNTSLPVFVTKTSDGVTVLNSNRQIVTTPTASTMSTKNNNMDLNQKFRIISPNRSVLVTDQSQKQGQVKQIVRIPNTNSGQIKSIGMPTSSIRLQQLPISGVNQKDLQPKTVGQLVNAKIINVQSNSESKNLPVKTFSGIRMINASDLNIANINGKQVIIATKSFLSNQNPQNMVFQTANPPKVTTDTKQPVNVSKTNIQTSTIGQPIILPKFQGRSINVKTMQGIKIIPFNPSIAQASQVRPTVNCNIVNTNQKIIKKGDSQHKPVTDK